MKSTVRIIMGIGIGIALAGCETAAPKNMAMNPITAAAEKEYEPYLQPGTATLTGQAFLVQRGGGTVRAAGKAVTLDPATSLGTEWWQKMTWRQREFVPVSINFPKARHTTTADADGRFKFTGLPAGKYYVRTEVVWEVSTIQGGLVGRQVTIPDGQNTEVILNELAR